jgi:hypothetical protein
MAIKANYEKGDVFAPEAYFKIVKLVMTSSDTEQVIEDDRGWSKLVFEPIYSNLAMVMIYSDMEARRRNAAPIGQLGIEFEFNPNSTDNPWKCAYEALKNTKTIKDSIYCDI